MTLDILLIRASVSRAEQRRWFSSCDLVQHTLYVGDTGDCGVIARCYQNRLRGVLPELVIVFQPQAASAEKPRVPSWVKKSAVKKYIEHHDLSRCKRRVLGWIALGDVDTSDRG